MQAAEQAAGSVWRGGGVQARFLDWEEALPWDTLQAEGGDAVERDLAKAAGELSRKVRIRHQRERRQHTN